MSAVGHLGLRSWVVHEENASEIQISIGRVQNGTNLTIWLGGLVVPGAALGTEFNDDLALINLGDALTVTSLAYAIAINQLGDCSLLIAVSVLNRYQRLSMRTMLHCWVSKESTTPSFRQFDLGDGGNNADIADLFAALQRGVRSIFCMCSPPSTLTPMPNWTMNVNSTGRWPMLTFILLRTLATRNRPVFANQLVWMEFVQHTHLQK